MLSHKNISEEIAPSNSNLGVRFVLTEIFLCDTVDEFEVVHG